MPKRKRDGKGQDVDEKRHSKIRVQEVESADASTEQGKSVDSTESARGEKLQNGEQTKSKNRKHKDSSKKSRRERHDLERTEKTANLGMGDNVKTIAQVRKPKDSEVKQAIVSESKEQKSWKSSEPVGGQMIDLDPVFSGDEQHLLIAYDKSIAVYSTSTSLLVRKFLVSKSKAITGLALDPLNKDLLYTTTLSGQISIWDWRDGQRRNERIVTSRINAATTARQRSIPGDNGLLYTIEENRPDSWIISVHQLVDSEKSSKAEKKILFKFGKRMTHLVVSNGGKSIIATSGRHIIVGASDSPVLDNLNDLSYVWRIADCPEWIVSLDVRCRSLGGASKKHAAGRSMLEAVDVVLGGLRGAINVFEDIHEKLVRKEEAGKDRKPENVVSRTLHWHRNAVLSVKWSLDGE